MKVDGRSLAVSQTTSGHVSLVPTLAVTFFIVGAALGQAS